MDGAKSHHPPKVFPRISPLSRISPLPRLAPTRFGLFRGVSLCPRCGLFRGVSLCPECVVIPEVILLPRFRQCLKHPSLRRGDGEEVPRNRGETV
jgi:hypothetical protein